MHLFLRLVKFQKYQILSNKKFMEKFNWNYPTSMWVGENRIKDLSIACKNLNVKKP